MKVSDYIAAFLCSHGLDTVFTVVGGGAMHMNDSFGHHEGIHCIYHHHEQAAAIAAEGYARLKERPGVVCVTSGPGATNAITGVAGAWVDSIPMLILSGQTKLALTIKRSGLNLRCLGNQEIDIVPVVTHLTKYAVMLENPERIRYELEKALYLAENGRPGPCWIDIPLDIQGAQIEAEKLKGFDPQKEKTLLQINDFKENCGSKVDHASKDHIELKETDASKDNGVSKAQLRKIVKRLQSAKRPVIYAGNGIRIAKAFPEFDTLIHTLNIPVVTAWNSVDLIPTEDPLYAGRGGTMGNRAGNFAVQNSDLLLSLACRLNLYQSGYDVKTWARAAHVIAVDIDPEEMKKPTIRVDEPVCCDVKEFMTAFLSVWKETGAESQCEDWRRQCLSWKSTWPVVDENKKKQKQANVYAFVDELSRKLPQDAVSVIANGSASVVGSAAYVIKKNSRFLMNDDLSSMGWELPAAIGAAVAISPKDVICLAGDGSIQMNLQELQTILTNRLPIKIFLINNDGYQQIRLTQQKMFQGRLTGLGPDSGGLEFPSMKKLAKAYGYPYFSCRTNKKLGETIERALSREGAVICEVFVDKKQEFEPKSAAKLHSDGRITSPPLEDMAPFLPKEVLKANMVIDLVE